MQLSPIQTINRNFLSFASKTPLFLILLFFIPAGMIAAQENVHDSSFNELMEEADAAFTDYRLDESSNFLIEAKKRLLNRKQRSELTWRNSRSILAQADYEESRRKQERRAGEEALRLAEESMRLDPDNSDAARWCWKVNMYLASRERGFSCSPYFNRAKAILMNEIRRSPEEGELWFFFALLYHQAPRYLFGSDEIAVSALRYSIRLNDSPHHELILLAELLLALKRTRVERKASMNRTNQLFHLTKPHLNRIFYYEGVVDWDEMPHLDEVKKLDAMDDMSEARLAARYLANNLDEARENITGEKRYLDYFKRVAELLNRVDSQRD